MKTNELKKLFNTALESMKDLEKTKKIKREKAQKLEQVFNEHESFKYTVKNITRQEFQKHLQEHHIYIATYKFDRKTANYIAYSFPNKLLTI